MATSATLIGLADVQDLYERATGRRPSEATIRAYNSRGTMPRSVARGRWERPAIVTWVKTKRRSAVADVVAERQIAIQRAAAGGPPARLDIAVRSAKRHGLTWAQIAQALPPARPGQALSRQAAQERFGRLAT